MPLFSDVVSSALERAMDGVALRQRVISQNISNAMTPGYQASQVRFEGALADALRDGSSAGVVRGPQASWLASSQSTGLPGGPPPELGRVPATTTPTGAPSREDGNNVQLEAESSALLASGLQFDALVQAANYKHNVLRTAVRG